MMPTKNRVVVAGLFLLGCALSILYFSTLKVHFDNLQILNKAMLLLQYGQWTHFGNAGSGVGFVPGSFMTAVSALPMKIYFSPYAATSVILVFQAISWWLLYLCIRPAATPVAASFILIDLTLLFWLNPWRVEQSELYNPAYMSFFSALHMWSILKMRQPKFWLSFWNVLAIGFCMQIHYSFLLLALASLAMWYWRFVRVNWWGVLAGSTVVLASLIPYALSYLENQDLQVTLTRSSEAFIGRNGLLIYPVIKAIIYWFRYGSLYLGRHMFSNIEFSWAGTSNLVTLAGLAFHILKWPVAAGTLYLSAKIQWNMGKRVWSKMPFNRGVDRTKTSETDRIELYLFYLFAAMIVTSALSPVEFNHWHLLLCFPPIVAWMTILFSEWRLKQNVKRSRWAWGSVFALFMVFDVLGFMGSRSHNWGHSYHDDVIKHYQDHPVTPKSP